MSPSEIGKYLEITKDLPEHLIEPMILLVMMEERKLRRCPRCMGTPGNKQVWVGTTEELTSYMVHEMFNEHEAMESEDLWRANGCDYCFETSTIMEEAIRPLMFDTFLKGKDLSAQG